MDSSKQSSGAEEPPSAHYRPVSILHLSDTHNNLPNIDQLPPADMLIHTGDFTEGGSLQEFRAFNRWLELAAAKYAVRIVILGNHDVMTYRDDTERMRMLLSHATHVPLYEEFNVLGLKVVAYPYLRHGGRAAASRLWMSESCHAVDLFLSHVPAYGLLDANYDGRHCGCEQLVPVLQKMRPKVHLFGHIHESYGYHRDRQTGTLFVNSSLCDHPAEEIINPGHVILFQVPVRSQSQSQTVTQTVRQTEHRVKKPPISALFDRLAVSPAPPGHPTTGAGKKKGKPKAMEDAAVVVGVMEAGSVFYPSLAVSPFPTLSSSASHSSASTSVSAFPTTITSSSPGVGARLSVVKA